jgi:YbgC/YbaW family acyl-CoA thioester hydrolase
MFTFNKEIQFSDCDPAGIMFFGRLFYILHEGYELLLKNAGLWNEVFNNEKLAFPIKHTEADYSMPLRAGQEYAIQIRSSAQSQYSYTIAYQIFSKDTGQLCATASTVHVCIDKATFRKETIPGVLAAAIIGQPAV